MVTIVRRSHVFAGLLLAGLLGLALPSTAAEPQATRSTVTDLLGHTHVRPYQSHGGKPRRHFGTQPPRGP
ncbi:MULTISPECIES: hypothetical protein [unclassified Pseudomonas]|uniref:hypothetical protein n=1 Tax=unclassified Pseudomonas TaxID=196821 RepID=UPI0021691C12|nr:hypothetical protein [Pseudomonas sp. BIGb0381]